MTLTFHSLWMLCALGAAVLAAAAPRPGWRSPAAIALGFAAGSLWFSLERMPDNGMVGVVAAVMGAWLLARSSGALAACAVAGVLAAAYAVLLRAQGTPPLMAMPLAAAIPLGSVFLVHLSDRFLSPPVRDEALLGLVIGSVLVAMLPGVLDGWRAAAGLNLEMTSAAPAAAVVVPTWTLTLGAAAIGAGAAYAFWSRR